MKKNMAYTENGDLAYKSTGNKNLDFFGIAASLRYDNQQAVDLFYEAYKEDKVLAIKNLFYLRDIRSGLGERRIFRNLYQSFMGKDSHTALLFLDEISAYGRYDDYLPLLETEQGKAVASFLKEQFDKDLINKKERKSISLLPKWLPSINASNANTRKYARLLTGFWNMQKSDYRKALSFLRKGLIIENNLRENDFTFAYESVPSQAHHKYHNVFVAKDEERYDTYLQAVSQGKASIKTETLAPYQIIASYPYNPWFTEAKDVAFMNLCWDKMKKNLPKSSANTIVVRDGSGSMTSENGLPLQIATSMAILFAEQLEGDFNNTFITFSSEPRLVKLMGETLDKKLDEIYKYEDWSNTDISKVYDIVLEMGMKAKEKGLKPIENILIISDMEFDEGTENVPTYESIRAKFFAAELPFPRIIYWNVAARNVHFASDNLANTLFVSGRSKYIIDNIINGKMPDAISYMKEALAKYSFVDEKLAYVN